MKTSDTSFLSFVYRILFFTLGGCIVLGQFGRFELPGAKALYFHDVVIVMVCALFIWMSPQKILTIFRSQLGKLLVALNIWIIVTSVVHFAGDTSQLHSALLYLLRLDSIVCLGFVVSGLLKQNVLKTKELTAWIVGVGSGIAGLGFIQYILYPDTRGLQLLGWDDHYYRLISTIFDPGFTGILLVIGCLFLLVQLCKKVKNIKTTLIFKAAFLLSFVAMILTYSRASYLAFVVGILYLAWKLKKYILLVLLPIFAICIVFLPRPGGEGVKLERTASVVSRIESVDSSFTNFSLTDAIVGKGWYWKKEAHPTSLLGNTVVPNHSSAAENSYVFMFTSLGVIGTFLWIAILFVLLQWNGWRADTTSAFIAVGVHALFTNTFFYPFVLIVLAVIMASSGEEYPEKSLPKRR